MGQRGGGTNNLGCYLHARPVIDWTQLLKYFCLSNSALKCLETQKFSLCRLTIGPELSVWPGTVRMSLNEASELKHDTFSTKKHLCGRKKFSLL